MNKLKEFWAKNKDKIIFGTKCLIAGYLIGVIEGSILESRHLATLYERLPDANDPDDDVIEYEDGMELEEGKIYKF